MSKRIRDNFNVRSKIAIDSRYIVDNVNNIELPYNGLISFQTSDGEFYKYKNNVWSLLIKIIEDDILELQNKTELKDFVTIRSYGALCNGTDETSIIQTALNDIASKGIVKNLIIPKGTLYTIGSLNIPQGIVLNDYSSPTNNVVYDMNALNDSNTSVIHKRVNATGGTSGGFVSSVLYVVDDVTVNNNNFHWGITSVLNNQSMTGENVAIYGQGNKIIDGGSTWGGVFEVKDTSGGSASNGTMVGLEIDVTANSLDSTNRIGIDVIANKLDGLGADMSSYAGVRVTNGGAITHTAKFENAFLAEGFCGANFNAKGNGTYGFRVTASTLAVGIDLSNASTTFTNNIAMKFKGDDYIALEGTSTMKMKYNSTQGKLEFYNGTTRIAYVDFAGADHAL